MDQAPEYKNSPNGMDPTMSSQNSREDGEFWPGLEDTLGSYSLRWRK